MLTHLRGVSIENLKRVQHVNRGRLLLRTMLRPISPANILFLEFWVSNKYILGTSILLYLRTSILNEMEYNFKNNRLLTLQELV